MTHFTTATRELGWKVMLHSHPEGGWYVRVDQGDGRGWCAVNTPAEEPFATPEAALALADERVGAMFASRADLLRQQYADYLTKRHPSFSALEAAKAELDAAASAVPPSIVHGLLAERGLIAQEGRAAGAAEHPLSVDPPRGE